MRQIDRLEDSSLLFVELDGKAESRFRRTGISAANAKRVKYISRRLHQHRPVSKKSMTSTRDWGVDGAGHGEYLSVLLQRMSHGPQGSGSQPRLNDNHPLTHARDHAIALRKDSAPRWKTWRMLPKQTSRLTNLLRQSSMFGRMNSI